MQCKPSRSTDRESLRAWRTGRLHQPDSSTFLRAREILQPMRRAPRRHCTHYCSRCCTPSSPILPSHIHAPPKSLSEAALASNHTLLFTHPHA